MNLEKDAEKAQNLIDKLELERTATNVHTINKAQTYLRSLCKTVWWIEDEYYRDACFWVLTDEVRIFLETKDIDRLKKYLYRYI
jgi:2-C-methyl-D-erythritol 4-phosphate cytidylyltransferase